MIEENKKYRLSNWAPGVFIEVRNISEHTGMFTGKSSSGEYVAHELYLEWEPYETPAPDSFDFNLPELGAVNHDGKEILLIKLSPSAWQMVDIRGNSLFIITPRQIKKGLKPAEIDRSGGRFNYMRG